MFVNPATYSLAAINTPINLLRLHPSFTLFPYKQLLVNMELAIFYRTSINDGLYSPPRIQSRAAADRRERHIGNTIGIFIQYTHSHYLTFDIRSSYFRAGKFLASTGPSASISQFAPTLNLRF